MENSRPSSLWKHLTSEGDEQKQNLSQNTKHKLEKQAKATEMLCRLQTAQSTVGRGSSARGTGQTPVNISVWFRRWEKHL